MVANSRLRLGEGRYWMEGHCFLGVGANGRGLGMKYVEWSYKISSTYLEKSLTYCSLYEEDTYLH